MLRFVWNLTGWFLICLVAGVSQLMGIHFCIDEVILLSAAVPMLSYIMPWLQARGWQLKGSSCACGHDDDGAHGH